MIANIFNVYVQKECKRIQQVDSKTKNSERNFFDLFTFECVSYNVMAQQTNKKPK